MRQVTSIKGLILLRLMGQVLLILGVLASTGVGQTDTKLNPVPLAEHPRPDLQRQDWINLNGSRLAIGKRPLPRGDHRAFLLGGAFVRR